jgi:hypothetical protein
LLEGSCSENFRTVYTNGLRWPPESYMEAAFLSDTSARPTPPESISIIRVALSVFHPPYAPYHPDISWLWKSVADAGSEGSRQADAQGGHLTAGLTDSLSRSATCNCLPAKTAEPPMSSVLSGIPRSSGRYHAGKGS